MPHLLAKCHTRAQVERSAWRLSFPGASRRTLTDVDFALQARARRVLGETAVVDHDASEAFAVVLER